MKRSEFLKKSLAAGAGACMLGSVESCSIFDDPEMKVCAVADIEAVPFLVSRFNRKQIFLTYLDGELTIFSLICRHKKCTVEWEERDEEFVCPCHDGRYDRTGQVIDGPPPGPLHRYRYEIRNDEIWVLNEFL
ncbi:Rieske (2Fe-2S) protein [Pontibacter sp. G13]|uniref:QcrA and Rieske domain-containing protein n=1 Tax=Pontibacter sp. G13 TaxID=3074898 RepID=UPI00288C3D20|nr:Rieske (2Fe-2S) protein [Pontibacter sp. G13]WNJ17365.1 Rieske (2Fe-2S) protein [Pontibacter sp. G13]